METPIVHGKKTGFPPDIIQVSLSSHFSRQDYSGCLVFEGVILAILLGITVGFLGNI